MKKIPAPRLVTVTIFTTITIILWIFFSLYRILTSKPEVNVPPELLEPINPSLDMEGLDRLNQRVFFEESDVAAPLIKLIPLPTSVPEATLPTPEVSDENEIIETPQP